MAVMILGILSGMYLSPPGGGANGGPNYHIDKTKRVACEANRGVMGIRIAEFQMSNNRFPTVAELEKGESSIPRCPDGGKYYILDSKIYCTIHTEIAVPTPE